MMRSIITGCACVIAFFAQDLWAETVDSLRVLEAMVSDQPKDGNAWVRLGELYLQAERWDDAKKAFNKALGVEETARAYTGLGDANAAKGKGSHQRALEMYRKALGVDPTYVVAQVSIARVHVAMGNEDAEMAFLKAIEIDETYRPAYQELVLWYENAQLVQSASLLELCEKYVLQFPDEPMGYLHLAQAQVENYQYDDVLMLVREARMRFREDMRWMAIEAQTHAAQGNEGRGMILFGQYLKQVSDEERAYYEDLSLVATKSERAAYEAGDQREAFLKKFWETRDGALMLGGDARRLEHYRRVWYARTFFGRKIQPWDKRGEVYIRYGEPDYRSRSGGQNVPPPLSVQLFKEKKITALYEQTTPYRAQEPQRVQLPMMMPGSTYFPGQYYDGRDMPPPRLITVEEAENMSEMARIEAVRNGRVFEVNPATFQSGWLWEVMGPGGDVRLNLPPGMMQGIEPVVPVDRGPDGAINSPWESWVYLNVGEGKEFVFTDRFMNGDWDFPLVPNNLWHSALVSEVNNQSSAVQFMEAASTVPEYFDVPPGANLLGFYYDLASFQGDDGQSKLEVYFGIPSEEVELRREAGRVALEIERSLVLANKKDDSVLRTLDELIFRKEVKETEMGGLFVELASLQAPPGVYTLGVKLVDRTSGKWGMYRQEVEIPSFVDSLAISEVEMAWAVSDTPEAEKFKKGDVWVIPAPTRSYDTTRDAHLYYEVYHLKRDSFGQAQYKVTYTIRPNIERGAGVAGVLVGGIRALFAAGNEPEFTVSYERTTDMSDEPVFFELETSTLTPGLKMVEVTIDDLNSLQRVSRRAMFNVVEPPEPPEPKDPYDAAFEEAMKGLLGK